MLVWVTSTVEVLVIDVLSDVEIIVVGVITVPIAYSVDVPSGVAVDLFVDALAGVMVVGLSGIGGINVLNANAFAVVMTVLEFPVPTPVEDFSR